MSWRRWVAFGFAVGGAFLLGLVVGVDVGDPGPDPWPAGRRAPLDEQPRSAPDPQVRVAPRPDARERRHAPAAPTPADAPPTPSAPEPPRAQPGSITGRVTTAAGEGVEGVRITAVAETPTEWQGEAGGEPWDVTADVETRVRKFERRARFEEASRRTATSAADGSYAIDALTAAEYVLVAKSDAWRVWPHDPQAARFVRPGSTLDFVAHRIAKFEVTVLLPDGSVANHATLHLAMGSTRGSTTIDRARRTVEWQPGTYQVHAVIGDAGEMSSDPVEVELAAGGATPSVTLQVRSRPAIAGSVRFPRGMQNSAANVKFLRLGAGGVEPTDEELLASDKSSWVSQHGGGGFSLTAIPPGRYAVGVEFMNAGSIEARRTVEVRDGLVTVDLDLSQPRREDWVEAIVLSPEGEPVDDVQFSVAYKAGRSSGSRGAGGVIRRDTHTWWVRPTDQQHVAPGTRWWVRATSPKWGSAEAEFTPGPRAAVEIRFQCPARVVVTIARFAGSGHESALRVGVAPPAPAEMRSTWFPGEAREVDPTGRTTLGPFAPGEYDAVLLVPNQRVVSRRRVLLVSGDNEVSLDIPALHELVVDCGSAAAGQHVHVTRLDPSEGTRSPRGDTMNAVADRTGRAKFERLTEGEYEARSPVAGAAPQRVRIPGTTVVKF